MATGLAPPNVLQKGEDFGKWLKSVAIYLGAINVTAAKQKVNILLHLLGPDVQDIVETLPAIEGQEDEYGKMTKQLERYFKPKVNPVVERHTFNMTTYEEGRVEEYVAKLKAQARKCDFEAGAVDHLIRDKLVATCPSSKVKEAMLKEENLTLGRAITIWSTDSTVKEQARRMGKSSVEEEVNKVAWDRKGRETWRSEQDRRSTQGGKYEGRNKRTWRNANEQGGGKDRNWKMETGDNRNCFRCGKGNHLIRSCKVPQHVKCHNCGKSGHLKAACRDPQRTLNVEEEEDEEEHDEREDMYVYHATAKKKEAIKVNMDINGRTTTFIVDTGCPVTLIPEREAKEVNLQETSCKLTSYTGHDIPVKGKAEVKVRYDEQEENAV